MMANNPDREPPALLLTRPRPDAESFLADLRRLVTPGRVVISPVLRIVPTGEVPDLSGVAALIFTSVNGVRCYAGPPGLRAFCVGRKTTAAARQAGLQAELAGESADQLVAHLTRLRPEGALLHLRGAHARGAVAARLTQEGLGTRELIVYDQQACGFTHEAHVLLEQERPVVLPLFSPRSAEIVAGQAGARAPLWIVALSPAVARGASLLTPERLVIAARPDRAAICAAVAGVLRRGSPLEGPPAVP
ncbi:uroporphyrinogen-III synthase [Marinovum sp.]|uniref:uroporphyrinogen-III synthase n=1 Tax=Marinovum sp. TaxID=2024839 RepID=UPI002B2773D1|nr:uroporphyrinogen-III synthase [Marinovum sp.]